MKPLKLFNVTFEEVRQLKAWVSGELHRNEVMQVRPGQVSRHQCR